MDEKARSYWFDSILTSIKMEFNGVEKVLFFHYKSI
jgi:hypothetical protein